ncbi:MAG: site-specific integrase [Pricia sp.]
MRFFSRCTHQKIKVKIISLKQKKLKSGKSSLYLEYYGGSRKDKNGTKKHVRSFEYLKLYVYDKPQNAEQQRKNKEALKLAESILTIRKSDFIKGKYNMRNEKKGQITFLDFFRQMKEERYESNANYGNWDAALKHIERYCPEHVQLKDIDSDFVKDFKKYLDAKTKTKGGTPLSQNSKYTYFNKFRAALREAYTKNFIQHDVVKSVKSFEQAESVREYLTHSELQALSHAYCKYPVLKSAFIFSCLTGLRWSDIAKLKWSEVRDEDQGARVIFRQKKTDGLEYLYISGQARKLLGYRKNPSEKVFKGLK